MSVPVHGNYHGYYSKRPFVKDPRLALLPQDLFSAKRVLDIGCNEGFVTCEIAQSWGAQKVVGVDIDDILIRSAWRRRLTVWSMQAPTAGLNPRDEPTKETDAQATQKKRKRDSSNLEKVVSEPSQPDYFPASFEHSLGPLPIPPSQYRGKHVFPHNLSFRTADWVKDEIPEDSEGYDVVIAFSITKWIHLNGGDEGLRTFFRRVHSVLKSGGTFVLEPQAWDTYKKARRMDKRLTENAKDLKLRPEEFESILVSLGFGYAQAFGVTGDGGFRRPVHLYVKL